MSKWDKLLTRICSLSKDPVSYTHLDVYKRQSIQCVGEKLEYAVYEILSSHILHNYIEREVSAGLRIEWSSLSFFRKNEGSVTFCCRSPPSSEFFGT